MSFLEAVNEKYGELSPVQKRIADYMYKYPDEACFYSLREMAICGTISRPGSWETRL